MVQIFSTTLSLLATLLLASSTAAKTCVVQNNKSDDSIAITQAFNDCKNGGTVHFPKGKTYYPKSLIKISGLKNVNINFAGHIILPPFNTKYKGGSAYLELSGDHIKLYGGGTITGNGQSWYDRKDNTAPIVLRTTATNSVFGNFRIINAPRGHIAVTGSDNVVFENIYLRTRSTNSNFARNTDAWGVAWSKNIIFRNSELIVGDDCTAVNAGVTNLTVTNIKCVEGHGFSIGSLGRGSQPDYVKNVHFLNNQCHQCQNGIRIKTVPGGKGTVEDVKFQNVLLVGAENPIAITTHYFCEQNKNCNNDVSLNIKNVVIDNISGTTSAKDLPIVNIDCSKRGLCSDFSLSRINIKVAYKDGVILGADSRTTTGAYIANRVTDKLTKVHDKIYCCRSGSAADTQAIADIVHYYLQMYSVNEDEAPSVRTASALFQELCYQNKDNLMAGIIVAGWDEKDGPSVYNVPLGGSLHKAPFAIGGSGSTYIYGYCDAKYKDDMTREECEEFVKNSLALAMSRDGSSGGVIRMAVITKDGVERLFVPGNQLPVHWEG
ncbi:hypothetical protein G6F57_000718 [Rhizopus arrhizus]|uniref:proteasome endopeptidase complex n=1 Tax=Rhizopus oryzae TaxID=64495 RepID=A0A9P7BWQ6_RHIOR|nr:hypothetical protein G6F24_001226 [Rhizopus arrhizus]KAG1427123.1 hypothetical protein G6F58_001167 [Rhizopus delemar]KAG0818845.1 hypothetical protein G6F20_001235 [Rhizopus arrhizus]KAG0842616.1 hypothetical protein G6F19_000947 [Rhizopus arrhizus]KAG0844961.1 hypothetical protein G6F18_001406 [Rhizopus arrhizus]